MFWGILGIASGRERRAMTEEKETLERRTSKQQQQVKKQSDGQSLLKTPPLSIKAHDLTLTHIWSKTSLKTGRMLSKAWCVILKKQWEGWAETERKRKRKSVLPDWLSEWVTPENSWLWSNILTEVTNQFTSLKSCLLRHRICQQYAIRGYLYI